MRTPLSCARLVLPCSRLVLALAPLLVPALSPEATFAAELSGRITDNDRHAVSDAQVTVIEVGRSVLTGADGRYAFSNLPAGVCRVSIQRIGYAPVVRETRVGDSTVSLDVTLRTSLVEIPAVQVTASAHATTALTSPQPTSVLDGDALRTARATSLGATIATLPGLRNWSTGSDVGKPVIRGLRSDRVLVLADGQRLENQQWGDEHGPNVDMEDVNRIEVIRGPQSVLYGSDALGGIVNLIPHELPTAYDRPAFYSGRVGGVFETNGNATTGHAGIEGATGGLGFRGSLSGRLARDLETPDGKLVNSGGNDGSATAEAGLRGGWGSVRGSYAHSEESLEIHEDPAEDPAATPYQNIRADLARVTAMLPIGGGSHVDATLSHERNLRREFEAAEDADVALGLDNRTWTGDLRFHHAPLGRFSGIVGLGGQAMDFRKSGTESLVPASDVWTVAAYGFEQADFDRWHVSFGLRYDHRELSVEDDSDLGVSAQTRTYDAVTGNAGVLYRLAEPAAIAFNVGRGFRAPSSFDLFSNGVHEGTVSFEVGNPALGTETSLNTEISLRLQSSSARGEIGGYHNRIADFIYTRPTGTFDPGSGFEIFETVQGDATFTGGEAAVEWHPTSLLHFTGGADYVRGQNTATDTPLPWIPPFRATYGLRIEGGQIGAFAEPYLSLAGESNAAQDRLDPNDTPTGAYTLAHAGAGFRVPTEGQTLYVDVGVRNVFDAAYRDFMSRYKAYALAPGRNVVLRVTSRF